MWLQVRTDSSTLLFVNTSRVEEMELSDVPGDAGKMSWELTANVTGRQRRILLWKGDEAEVGEVARAVADALSAVALPPIAYGSPDSD